MHAIVHNIASVKATFISKEPFKLFIDVLDNGGKAVCVVDGISVTRSVHNSQSQLNASLLYLYSRSI